MSTTGFNQLILIGKLGKDPHLHYEAGGKARCEVTLVCTDLYEGEEGELKEKSHTFTAAFRSDEGERLHQLCRKGDQMLIEGRLIHQKDKGGRWQLGIEGRRFSLLQKSTQAHLPLWPEASQTIGKFSSTGTLADKEKRD